VWKSSFFIVYVNPAVNGWTVISLTQTLQLHNNVSWSRWFGK